MEMNHQSSTKIGYRDSDSTVDNEQESTTLNTRVSRSQTVRKQSTLEKTLLRFYQKKLNKENENQEAVDCSSGSFIEFYVPGASTYSLAPLQYSVNDPNDESFANICLESFLLFAQKHNETAVNLTEFDRIPVTKLGKAIQKIMYTITPKHINEVADYYSLLDDKNATLSWNDFKQFVNQILDTLPAPQTMRSASANDISTEPRHKISTVSDKMGGTGCSSSVKIKSKKEEGTVHLSSLSNLPGLNASKNFAKEEMIDIYRREEHFRRQIKVKDRTGWTPILLYTILNVSHYACLLPLPIIGSTPV